jgi:hypothetical protein
LALSPFSSFYATFFHNFGLLVIMLPVCSLSYCPITVSIKMQSDRGVYTEAPARPSIVIAGTKGAWDEENWSEFTVGGMQFRKIKECPRCTVK